MSQAKDIMAFVSQSKTPVTTAQIGAALGLSINQVASRMTRLIQTSKVSRTLSRRTLTGAPVYQYTALTTQAPVVSTQAPVVSTQAPVVSTQAPSSIDVLIDTLAKSMADQVMSRLKAHLTSNVTELTRLPAPPKCENVVVQRARLPRVGVTGLLPQQAGMLQSEFHDTFDLSFWNDRNGDNTPMLRAMGQRCEMVFHHVDHASHTTDEVLKSCGAQFKRVGGGMSTLRNELTKYYVQITDGATA